MTCYVSELYPMTYAAVQNALETGSEIALASISPENGQFDLKHQFEVVLRSFVPSPHLDRILELSFDLVRKEALPPHVPSAIASDFLSCGTVQQCFDSLFALVEQQMPAWKQLFGSSKINLLRSCNDLLRRVCRVHMTEFCGRIQLFLSQLYPMTEKSALNLTSNFNQDRCQQQQPPPDDLEQNPNKISDHFQILQHFLTDPSVAFKKWDSFIDSLNCVLDCLYSYKLPAEQCRTNFRQMSFVSSTFSSESDLDSQMSDPLFRQQFLIQILIACRYFTDPIKFRQEDLSREMSDELNKALEKTGQLLDECSNQQQQQQQTLKQSILSILQRESKTWNAWKNAGCPAKLMMTPQEAAESDEFDEPALKKPHTATTNTTTTTSNQQSCENLLKAIGQQQQSMWSTEQTPIQELTASPDFFDSALKIFDLKTKPSEFVVPEETWSWRALRLARGTRMYFPPPNQSNRKVNEFLFHILEKMKTRQINRESAKLVAKDPPVVAIDKTPVNIEPVVDNVAANVATTSNSVTETQGRDDSTNDTTK